MKITAKEILADKGNIYKNMTKEQLNNTISEKMSDNDFFHLCDLINCNNSEECAKKLWQRWHYKDGRPKPPRVHEVTRLRERLKKAEDELYNKNCYIGDMLVRTNENNSKTSRLRSNLDNFKHKYSDSLAQIANYQKEVSDKNIEIFELQGELSKAHNTTKIVAFVSLVIILGLILIPYFS